MILPPRFWKCIDGNKRPAFAALYAVLAMKQTSSA